VLRITQQAAFLLNVTTNAKKPRRNEAFPELVAGAITPPLPIPRQMTLQPTLPFKDPLPKSSPYVFDDAN
jgi:hypothetical protein